MDAEQPRLEMSKNEMDDGQKFLGLSLVQCPPTKFSREIGTTREKRLKEQY
ncbi:hypothetical protein GGD83_001712 [Rhodoblastus sphagnicola]|nr:hypothetical protein [Rhodoblastus sphagnicola]